MENKSSIMIFGASPEQKPLYLKAKEKGYRTIAIDTDPEAECFSIADKYYTLGADQKGLLLDIALKEKIKAATSMITEWGHEPIDYISREMGLSSFSRSSLEATVDKRKMRELFQKARLNHLDYMFVESEKDARLFLEKTKCPIVLKPKDSSGQRGISKIKSPSEIKKGYVYAMEHSKGKSLIAEKYFPGQEFHCAAAVLKRKVAALSISRRVLSKTAFGVAVRHIYPGGISGSARRKMHDICAELISLFELENAIIYPQFMINGDGEVVLIEYAERMPGGLLYKLFELTQGFDIVRFQLDISLGEAKRAGDYEVSPKYDFLTIKFLNGINGEDGELRPGRVREVKNLEEAKNLRGIIGADFFGKNKLVKPLENGLDRFFYIIASGKSIREAVENSDAAAKKLEFVYER
ncbi:MAG: ATP-grasp domain-containing protein [Candidatus Omnitrophota bacterium]|jgi:biotin carboxylase